MSTDDQTDAFVAAVARGLTLIKAEEETGLSRFSFLRKCEASEELAQQYARARSIADAAGFEALDELSDEAPPVDQYGKVDPGWVAWQRMRIDTRKWTLARRQPTKYGDKTQTEISGPGGSAIPVSVSVSFVAPKVGDN